MRAPAGTPRAPRPGAYLADRRRRRAIKVATEAGFYLLLGVLLIAFMFVFYWMVVTSLKLPREVTVYPPALVFEPTLMNYRNVLEKTPFFHQLSNSLIVAIGAVTLAMVVGLPASYAISRYRLKSLALTILMMRMMPTIVFMLPLFVVYQRLGLIDTHAGLIFSHLILTVPLIVWIMIGFFEDVPGEVEDQARVDGCRRWGVFWRIALPLSAPGIVVTTILSFITSWNNFVFVLILGGVRTTTLPLAVFNFMGFEMLDFGGVAAVASMLSLPIIVLTIIVQRWLVGGLTLGAIK
ncbi:MAG: carbohydrate ABC transporter permease [Trueperaceae bacterium]|nr:carbohydrate ABC transporter permease [Trueperaceae bacterium]